MNKFEICLVHKMLLIRELSLPLNVQWDLIQAKIFAWHCICNYMLILSEFSDSLSFSIWTWIWCHDITKMLLFLISIFYLFVLWGSRDGAAVRVLAFHQCVPGSTPRPSVTCGLSLLLVLFSGTPVFPSLQKPTLPNSNSSLKSIPK